MNLWDVLVSIFWFMILVAWFWLLIIIMNDLFRDRNTSGVAKALWCLFVIILPWIGTLTYLLVRGRGMGERANAEADRNEKAFRSYVQNVASSGSGGGLADELTRLADLRDQGRISPQDYEQAKQRLIGAGQPAAPTHVAAAPETPHAV